MDKMQPNSVTNWTTLLNRLHENPKDLVSLVIEAAITNQLELGAADHFSHDFSIKPQSAISRGLSLPWHRALVLRVSQLMKTLGQYLRAHPVLALTALTFSSVAALPVGLFLSFALVTIIMSAVGFLFFEGFLLFVGGLVLLSVLFGIALFSIVVWLIFQVLYIAISKILSNLHSIKGMDNETSKLKETQ